MAQKAGRAKGVKGQAAGCFYNVESIVSVDGRGQMVLPKETREKVGIKPGDKLAVVVWGCGGDTCCITLIKAERLADVVKGLLETAQEFNAERKE